MEDEIVEILAEAYRKKGYIINKENAKRRLKGLEMEEEVPLSLDRAIEKMAANEMISVEDAKRVLEDVKRDAENLGLRERFDYLFCPITPDLGDTTTFLGSWKQQKYFNQIGQICSLLCHPNNVFFIYKRELKIEPPQWFAEKYAAYK